jgi:hypothetical protein
VMILTSRSVVENRCPLSNTITRAQIVTSTSQACSALVIDLKAEHVNTWGLRACRRVVIAFQIRGVDFEFDESRIAQGIDELMVRKSPWNYGCG